MLKAASNSFNIESILWCRDLETDGLDVEVSVFVHLDATRRKMIPENCYFIVFVTINPFDVVCFEEIILGREEIIELLTEKEKCFIKAYVRENYYNIVLPSVLNMNYHLIDNLSIDKSYRKFFLDKNDARRKFLIERRTLFTNLLEQHKNRK